MENQSRNWFSPAAKLPSYDARLKAVTTPELKRVGLITLHKLAALESGIQMPVYALHWGMTVERLYRAALDELGHQRDRSELSEAERNAVNDRTTQIVDGYMKILIDNKQMAENIFIDFVNITEVFIEHSGPGISDGFRALLSNHVVGAWTVFETTASDIWESAINVCPKRITSRKNKKGAFNPDILKTFIGRLMGTYGKDYFNFQKLAGIQQAFSAAFPDTPSIRNVLWDMVLGDAAAIRNVYVHKAGFVDAEFLKQVADPLLKQMTLDTPFPIDGQIASKHANACINNTLALLEAVDQWIINNK